MRFTLLLLTPLLFMATLSGQNVKEKTISLNYQVPPTKQLDAELTTYSTVVGLGRSQLLELGLTESQVTGKLKLRNFKKLSNGGHLRVSYDLAPFDIDLGETKSQTTETKKKDGTVVKTTTYWQELPWTFPISIRVEDMNGGIVYESIYGSEIQIYRYPARNGMRSKTEMLKGLRKALKAEGKKLARNQVNKATDALNGRLRERIDVRVGKENLFLEYPAGKKAENAEAWETSVNTAHAILSDIGPETPPSEDLRDRLEAQTSFWTAQLANYDPGDKKERKYYHSAAFNLAVIDYALEDFSSAARRANDLEQQVNWNKDRCRTVKRMANTAGESMSNYPAGSRHYPLRDLSEARGPDQPTYGEVPPVEVVMLETTGYVIHREYGRMEGTFTYAEKDLLRPDFGPRDVRFTDQTGNYVEVSPRALKEMRFDAYHYVSDQLGSGLVTSLPHNNFYRVLEDGEMKLMELQPFYPDDLDTRTLYIIRPDGKDVSLNFSNPRWANWKSAFAKLFEGCPGLQAAIRAGAVQRDREQIRQSIADYNAGNCSAE